MDKKEGARLAANALFVLAEIDWLGNVFEQLAPEPRHAPQLGERFGFDLTNPLAADAQLLAYLAQSPLVATIQAEPQPQYLSLARV